jgi:IS605 OrfB family transposase
VVHRTARCGLRLTRLRRNRVFGLLRSAGDVWCAVLELSQWRRARQDWPLAGFQELCWELAASGPGTFGELDTAGARSVLRRYSDADVPRVLQPGLWAGDPYLRRLMRRHWKHGRNRTRNQIVVRSDQYKTFTLTDGGNAWLAVPGLERRQLVTIPLNTTVAPAGTLRLILRSNKVEVHYAIDAAGMKSSRRPCGTRTIGVDKGYTEVLTDSDGQHHGEQLGRLLSSESDHRKVKNARRARLRSLAEKAEKRGDRAKAARIRDSNLGTLKRDRRSRAWQCRVRDLTFQAVHAVTDKASVIVAEDLTRSFAGRKKLGKNTNRRLAAWTKGVTAEALQAVQDRRGSAVRLVNAAYTSQAVPFTNILGVRQGDRLHCTMCGAVWQADHAAAINILHRDGDPGITLHTPHTRVKQLVQERADRQRSRLPDQDSSTATMCRCGEQNIRPTLNTEQ